MKKHEKQGQNTIKVPAKRAIIGAVVLAVLVAGGFAGWYWYGGGQSDGQSTQSTVEARDSFGGEVLDIGKRTIKVRNSRLERSRTFTITDHTRVVDGQASETVTIDRVENGMKVNIRYDTRSSKAVSIWF